MDLLLLIYIDKEKEKKLPRAVAVRVGAALNSRDSPPHF